MVHWKTRGLFGVHRGELRTATAQGLREENTVFTVLWKSLRHGRPQRSSEPTHYSRSHITLSKKYSAKGGFFSESAIHFSDLQISKKKYSKKTILNLNSTVIGW